MRYNMSIVLQGINNILNFYFSLATNFFEPRSWHGDSQECMTCDWVKRDYDFGDRSCNQINMANR